ncbi:hypothetical protein PybrP1_012616 [[Pythium] brassicae (nom. inval.)]|nr:hypothetical protein PybrP1_012616 [[Pythium] brassicae (nom. inval.)]
MATPMIDVPVSARTPLVTRSSELVAASTLQQRAFDSWEQFHEHLSAYGQRTAQLFSVRSATPAARRNEKVRKRKSASAAQLIPESFSHYVKTIACTHGGKPRPRSTGVRPNHQHRAIECPAQVLATVNVLRKAEARRKKIHEYMVENTAHDVKMKDVHNLLSKLNRTDGRS